MTYQAVGTGVGSHTDAGGKGTTLPGGKSLPKFFCQEGHQWGEEAQTNIGAGEQDLRGSWGTRSLRQHWLYRFLGRELTGRRTATPHSACLSLLCQWGPAPGKGVHAKILSVTNTRPSLDVHVNRVLCSDFPEVWERKWDNLFFFPHQKGTVVFFLAVLGTEVSNAPSPLPWNKAEKRRGRSAHSHRCMP